MAEATKAAVNGIDVEGLMGAVGEISEDPSKGLVKLGVTTTWEGGTRTRTNVKGCEIGGQWIERPFEFKTDEPLELFGGNSSPNPQEYLMGSLNSCMSVGYVAGAALRGITLTKLEIETTGEIDLRGFLGIDETVKPGYDEIRYTVRIDGDGTPEQFEEIHQAVMKTSPNYFNLAQPVKLTADLVVG